MQNSLDLPPSSVSHEGLPAQPSVEEIAVSAGTLPVARHDGESTGFKSRVVILPLYDETKSTLAAAEVAVTNSDEVRARLNMAVDFKPGNVQLRQTVLIMSRRQADLLTWLPGRWMAASH
jgi:hypothetical protein